MKYLKSYKLFESSVPKSEKVDIFRDDKYIVVSPLTYKASCKYGAFTQWCISVPSDPTAWNVGMNTDNPPTIVFIIQRNYKPTDEELEHISRHFHLKDRSENDNDLSDDELEELLDLEYDLSGYDFSKIAIIKNERNGNIDIWDAENNNVNGDRQVSIYDLPIDDYVIGKVAEYLDI